MIVCPRCSKENQDHYKFCLGCGAELPRDAAKKEFVAPTANTDPPVASAVPMPPASAPRPAPVPAVSAPAPAMAPAPGAGNNCPACGNPVPTDFKFCGTCGHRMDAGPTPAPAPAPVAAPASGPARGKLVVINPDGTEGSSFPLSAGTTQVGRSAAELFAADAYLSPVHASFTFQGSGCVVRDEDSLNGVYIKLERDQPVALSHGSIFRIGQEIARFELVPEPAEQGGVQPMGSPNPGYLGRISLVIGRDTTANAFTVPPDGLHLGRERGDVIFPDDGYVSGLHCRIHHDGRSVVLTDVGSSNGTFLRIQGEAELQGGELLLMGQQLFRFEG
ncbi:MAG: FHA domain-containing protein [Myxococcales bacterium]|nr:FHA domain-containing protein [Myxococcales bacterium]